LSYVAVAVAVAVAVVVVQMTAACSFSITGPGEKVLHNIIILSQEVLEHPGLEKKMKI
jgi:hypothetical protein